MDRRDRTLLLTYSYVACSCETCCVFLSKILATRKIPSKQSVHMWTDTAMRKRVVVTFFLVFALS